MPDTSASHESTNSSTSASSQQPWGDDPTAPTSPPSPPDGESSTYAGYAGPPPAASPPPLADPPPAPTGAFQSAPALGMAGAITPGAGPIGKVRPTGVTILLMIVTLGIYGYVWFYFVHDEMKRHTGRGLGGGIAVVLAVLVGVVMPFLTSNEVGEMYEARREPPPVSTMTGLWNFPGAFIIVGPIIWFVKTNGALNRYWESLGATP